MLVGTGKKDISSIFTWIRRGCPIFFLALLSLSATMRQMRKCGTRGGQGLRPSGDSWLLDCSLRSRNGLGYYLYIYLCGGTLFSCGSHVFLYLDTFVQRVERVTANKMDHMEIASVLLNRHIQMKRQESEKQCARAEHEAGTKARV